MTPPEKRPTGASPVFFIIGVPRSGTTLLELMLDHHSEIGVCPESNFMENILRYGATERFRTDWHFREFVGGISHWLKKFNDPAYDLVQQHYARQPDYSGPSRPIFNEFISAYLSLKQKRIFGEKTPENAYFLPQLKAFCPEAKLVVLLRHPLDTICSLSKSLARVKGIDQPYSDANLLQAALFVKRGLQSILRHTSADDPHVFTLTYESLVQAPEQTLTSLCSFLGVNFEAEMLAFSSPDFFTGKDPRSAGLHEGLSKPLDASKIGQFEQVLTQSQVGLVCRFLSNEMAHLPYEGKTGHLSFRQTLLLAAFRFLYGVKQPLWREWWIQVKIKVKERLVPFMKSGY